MVKIDSFNALKKFGEENGYHVDDYGEFGWWSLSNSNMIENLDVVIGSNGLDDCIMISNKEFSESTDVYRLEDWNDISFTLSDGLNIKIDNGSLFLSAV